MPAGTRTGSRGTARSVDEAHVNVAHLGLVGGLVEEGSNTEIGQSSLVRKLRIRFSLFAVASQTRITFNVERDRTTTARPTAKNGKSAARRCGSDRRPRYAAYPAICTFFIIVRTSPFAYSSVAT